MDKITPDALAAGFALAALDIAPSLQGMELAALIGSFAMMADVLRAFGISEAQLIELARESARLRLVSAPVLH